MTSHPTSSPAAAGLAGITIRPLASLADYQACVALQTEVWGARFDGAVPAALMQVAVYAGGLVLGAFAGDELVGFVFGLTGVDESGQTMHWSHILGVRATLRNAGVGRLLKERQRAELAARHIGEMYWTFDPLIAKNAHLNLNLLGARVVRYVPDMYGTTGSPLHHGLATDRLVVVCDTAGPLPHHAGAFRTTTPRAVLTPAPQPGDTVLTMSGDGPRHAWLEVPTDFPQLLLDAPALAASWHAATREHFQWALQHGYAVTGLHRDPVTSRAFYLLDAAP